MSSALEGDQPAGGTVDNRLPKVLREAFAGGGEMGARLREFDWSGTPLGAPDRWPACLCQALVRMLASQAQIVLFWGAEHIALYNDAYAPTIGAKHPAALGQPARRSWAELWDVLEPLLVGVRETGVAYRGRDHPFVLERHGFLEQTYFDVSYDPVRGEDGTVEGIFCIVSETTGRVVGERRLRVLAELGSGLTNAADVAELGRRVGRVLDGHRDDLPVALLYLIDEGTGSPFLAGCSGVAPAVVSAVTGGLPPTLTGVLAGGPAGSAGTLEFLREAPAAAADRVLVLPVTTGNEPAGALVVAPSQGLALTDDYRDFIALVAGQIAGAGGRIRAYERERARAAELAALDRAKTEFFANVSHEFRTPLTLVLGPLEEALGDTDLPPRVAETLAVAHRNALRLLRLVNTVLDFSRLQSGRIRARYLRTDLADYTARLVSTFRSAAERAGLRLVVDCPALPEPVFVDRDMWEKIVLNLVSNALKFTLAGEIRVRVERRDGCAVLEVSDTGVGIPPEELPHVFDRFHRVPGVRSRSHEGTGIGLVLVRELVELHGGTVAVRSRLDRGSSFTVSLPFGSGHLPADRVVDERVPLTDSEQVWLYAEEAAAWTTPSGPDETPVGPPAGAEEGWRRPRILVADDNADLREHVTRLLSPYWEVVAVPDGAAAFAAAVASPFDLVLGDVMMPRLDGFGLVARLRADRRTRHLPIVLLTARAGTAEAAVGLSAGADDYLVKPFAAQELIARVRANVELGQLRGRIIQRLRGLADVAVAVNGARTTAEVLQVAARHALRLVEAGRVEVSALGARCEMDADGRRLPAGPPALLPLTGVNGEHLGELRVWPRGERGGETEHTAMAQLARLVGVRLENIRRYETEHRIATTLQHSLLPASLPQLPGALVASRYLPGSVDVEVGGDWYDVVRVEDELVLAIGDVVGKGVHAAAAMGQLRNALRAYVLEGFDPGRALTRLNRLVTSIERRLFATVALIAFHPRTGRLRYASAGHPAPLLIRKGQAEFLHERPLGPPVGALSDMSYKAAEGRLAPGDRLLLYTDGLVEDRQQDIDAGLTRLRADACVAREHVDDLVGAVVERAASRPRRDDVAVLALEAVPPDRFTLRLPADPTALSVLRKRLEDFLVGHRVGEEDLFDLIVAVSEAAANAIEHPVDPAEPVVTVEVTIADRTAVAVVRDTGRWREPGAAGFRGRGLALIRALGDLTVRRTDDGTELILRRRLR